MPSMPAKRPSLPLWSSGAECGDGAGLGEGFDDEDAGHDRAVGEVALEEPFVGGDVLERDGAAAGFEFDDAVDQQEGEAVGDQGFDLFGGEDGFGVGHCALRSRTRSRKGSSASSGAQREPGSGSPGWSPWKSVPAVTRSPYSAASAALRALSSAESRA